MIILKIQRKEKGITLVALGITIIIILILAGVTLTTALGQNGLFQRAKTTVEDYEVAQENEESELSELTNQVDKLEVNQQENKTTGPNGKPLPKTVTGTNHDDVEGEDRLGNPVVIPGGFRFAGDKDDTVGDGIVIEDEGGNQFVWIPVSNINGDNDEKTTNNQNEKDLIVLKNNTKVEITLGRYAFDTTNGTPELKQVGNTYTSTVTIGTYHQEPLTHPNGGTPPKNLKGFIDSVESKHGYYIARYEAGNEENKVVSKKGAKGYNNINQSSAAGLARNMYNGNEYVESDLVNSYAWDTAIVYIQKMGHNNYANQTCGTNTTLKNTGETEDEKCHIYDMACNLQEWTTEYSIWLVNGVKGPCVPRGGDYNTSTHYVAHHNIFMITTAGPDIGFRSLFYFKQL